MTLPQEESVSHSPDPLIPETVPGSGLHIIAYLRSKQARLLRESKTFQATNALNKLGQVYHDFSKGAYTAVVFLSESHLSVHTGQSNNPRITRANYHDGVHSFNRRLDSFVLNIFFSKVKS